MDVLHRVPLRVADLVDRPVPDIGGVIHKDMDIAEMAERRANEASSEVPARHASGIGDRLAASILDPFCGRFGGLRIEIVDDDARALLGKPLNQAETNAAAAACDQSDLSGKPRHARNSAARCKERSSATESRRCSLSLSAIALASSAHRN